MLTINKGDDIKLKLNNAIQMFYHVDNTRG